jgi:hypothetical protein
MMIKTAIATKGDSTYFAFIALMLINSPLGNIFGFKVIAWL